MQLQQLLQHHQACGKHSCRCVRVCLALVLL
jgi:hypothetical protein